MKKYRTHVRVTIEITRMQKAPNQRNAEMKARAQAKALVGQIKAAKRIEILNTMDFS